MEAQDEADRPCYHVAPREGWVNDPNGPFMYKGKFHLFYQHLPGSCCEWDFGLVWGHAVSSDLIRWEHLPHALEPTPGGLDANGCFSGCATVDTDGQAVILYTGVRLRTNGDAGPLPPPDRDLQLPFIESQIAATPLDPSDANLVHWVKDKMPFLDLPPPDLDLTGWRDPFVAERPSAENGWEWVVLMGSGLRGRGGTCLVYRTPRLRDPSAWRYDGLLCSGDGGTGAVWECPLLSELQPLPATALAPPARALGLGGRRRSGHFASDDGSCGAGASPGGGVGALKAGLQRQVSAGMSGKGAAALATPLSPRGQHHQPCSPKDCTLHQQQQQRKRRHFYTISPDACTNPTIYWLGDYAGGRFDLDGAVGPFRLDLGDVLYAPNVMVDDSGRTLLWAWLQEKRTVGTYGYAGCMGVPRVLHLDPDADRIWQSPVPEINTLRSGGNWRSSEIPLPAGAPFPLPPGVGGAHLDVSLTARRGSGSAVGIMLQAWSAAAGGGAAVIYHWDTCLLEVVFEALDPVTMRYSLTAPGARHVGGPLDMRPGEPLQLRLLIDGSVLEVFTGTGQVLATRVYRGVPSRGAAAVSADPVAHAAGDAASAPSSAGIEFFSLDGDAVLARVEAYEMASIWSPVTAPGVTPGDIPGLAAALERAASLTAAAGSRGGSLAASLGRSSAPGGGGAAALALVADRLAAVALSGNGGGVAAAAPPPTPLSPPRVFAGGGDAWPNDAGGLPPEEEMCNDIFGIEGVS